MVIQNEVRVLCLDEWHVSFCNRSLVCTLGLSSRIALMIGLSPAEPHYSLLSSNQNASFLLENRHSKNPRSIADSRFDTQTFLRQSYHSLDIGITHAGMEVDVQTPANATHDKRIL